MDKDNKNYNNIDEQELLDLLEDESNNSTINNKKESEIDDSIFEDDNSIDEMISESEKKEEKPKKEKKSFFSNLFKKKEKNEKVEEENKDDLDNLIWEVQDIESDEQTLDEIEKEELEKKKEEEKIIKEMEEEAKKEAEKKLAEEKKKNKKTIDPKTVNLFANIFVLLSIFIAFNIFSNSIYPDAKKIEVYNKDQKLIKKDLNIINKNLEILTNEKSQAFTYRKLNYDLEQAVPIWDKYEDSIQIIQNILKDSVTAFDRNEKYLKKISLKPKVDMRDINIIDLGSTQLYWINYQISVSWFKKYKYIKDFIRNITNRLKIFHISSLSIVKKVEPKTGATEYTLNISMFSYYRLPKLDEEWNPIEEKKENTFPAVRISKK